MTVKLPYCHGLMGWLFGHKFIKEKAGRVYASDFCFRCGFKP